MCFNVYAHNRDDPQKTFFLYDDTTDLWHLSPAYDLTFSSTYYGEHTTTVDGNGRNPGKMNLSKLESPLVFHEKHVLTFARRD